MISGKTVFAACMAAASVFGAVADTVAYTNAGSPSSWWGTGKSETYDVAVRLGPDFKGLEVRSVSFIAGEDADVAGFSVWMSERLQLGSDKTNVPDVISLPVEVTDGEVSVSLPAPYVVGDGGVYIGYSFTVGKRDTERQKSPVAVVRGGDAGGHGFWVHSSRTYGIWSEGVAGEDVSVPFRLELGRVDGRAVKIRIPGEVNAGAGNEMVFDAEIVNCGALGATSIELEWSAGGDGGRIPVALVQTLPALYLASVPVRVSLPSPDATGDYDLKVRVAGIDGEANTAEGVAAARLYVWSSLPRKRPLLEEYTSTDCGYCPRGAVGMEKMAALKGLDFVGVSYHHADVMSIMSPEEYPNPAPAQPVAWLDRHYETDPYFGDRMKDNVFAFDEIWERMADEFTPADIALDCRWADDAERVIEAKADLKFVKAFEGCDFRMSYILVADGLTGEGRGWHQGNYYSGETGKWPSDFDHLVDAPNPIQGMVFNDVVILYPFPKGMPESLPSSIGQDQEMSHSVSLSLDDACNLNGETLVHDGLDYSVVAMVIDGSTGKVVNCVKSPVGDGSGVDVPEADEAVVTLVFDMFGRMLPHPPASGIYVETKVWGDGRRTSHKVAR